MQETEASVHKTTITVYLAGLVIISSFFEELEHII